MEFLTASLSRSTCRSDQLPGFLAPSTTPLGQAPYGVDRPRPLPVPLSGFRNLSAVSQQVRVSRPCFMPQPFGILPSEVSPRRNRAPLPGPLLLPCGHPPTCRMATVRALSPPVSSTPALLAQLPLSPGDYGIPFHAPESTLPGPPGLERRNPSCSARFIRFEALILLRIRSRFARVAPNAAVAPLLGFRPSRVFSAQTSDPRPTQTERGPEHEPRTATDVSAARRPHPRAKGPHDPSPRVRPPQHNESPWVSLVGSIQPSSGLGRTASRRRILLP